MGYSTDFTGAILVTPKVDPTLAAKINLYLNTRHDKIHQHPRMAEVVAPDSDLLGCMMPNFEDALECADGYDPLVTPHFLFPGSKYETALRDAKISLNGDPNATQYCGSEYDGMGYNSDLYLIQDPFINWSFLVWSNREKTMALDRWVQQVFDILRHHGYYCGGRMFAQGEDAADQWSIVVENNTVTKVDGRVEPTWVRESASAQERSEEKACNKYEEAE